MHWRRKFSLSCIGEENGNPLQYSCLENPRDGAAWWAAVYGVTQSRTRLKWLSNSRIAGGFFTNWAIREAQGAEPGTNPNALTPRPWTWEHCPVISGLRVVGEDRGLVHHPCMPGSVLFVAPISAECAGSDRKFRLLVFPTHKCLELEELLLPSGY